MAIGTYSELQTALGNWLNRSGESETTSRAPEWIALFEAKVIRNLRVRQMEQRSTASLNGRYLALPASPDAFLEMRLMKVNTDPAQVVQYLPPSTFWEIYGSDTTGTVKSFTIVGSEIAFGPSPDSTDTVEMWFYQFDALSDSNTTNWLLTSHPDLYLYGSLCEAEPYFGNDARLPMWKTLRDEGLEDLKTQDVKARYAGSPLVTRALAWP